MQIKEKSITSIGKTEGFYPKINHFQRMIDNDFSGMGTTQTKALTFWQSVFDFAILEKDPFIENQETVLKLHEQVLKLPIADFIFNDFKQVEFSEDEILQSAFKRFSNTSQNSVKRDIKAILKMYSENTPENPFFDLGLITFDGNYERKNK